MPTPKMQYAVKGKVKIVIQAHTKTLAQQYQSGLLGKHKRAQLLEIVAVNQALHM